MQVVRRRRCARKKAAIRPQPISQVTPGILAMTNDSLLAQLARDLAIALQDYGYTRKDEDKKRVHEIHARIVLAAKLEQDEVQ